MRTVENFSFNYQPSFNKIGSLITINDAGMSLDMIVLLQGGNQNPLKCKLRELTTRTTCGFY